MTFIYRITPISILRSIVECGGIHCDRAAAELGLAGQGIAHSHIKARRARRAVPVCRGGTLADYVPFYFAPRSPMLYALHRGAVEGYTGGQRPILHLVATAEDAVASGLACAFTDGHADMGFTEFYEDLRDLDKIDWAIMREKYWRDTVDDPDRSRRRQSEFLVHGFFPWNLVHTIGVINRAMAAEVGTILAGSAHQPEVSVKPEWYY